MALYTLVHGWEFLICVTVPLDRALRNYILNACHYYILQRNSSQT